MYTVAGLPAPPTTLSPAAILVVLPGEEIEYWSGQVAVTSRETMVLFKVLWRDGDRYWFEWSRERPR